MMGWVGMANPPVMPRPSLLQTPYHWDTLGYRS